MTLGRETIQQETSVRTDTYTAARKLGFSIDYLIRNATKGEGDKHGAVDQFADAVCEFVDTAVKELRK